MFKDPSGGERPDGGPLSLDRDLRGGIGEGLGGHVAVKKGELGVEVERRGCVVLRGAEVPFRVVGRLQVIDTVNDPPNEFQMDCRELRVKSRASKIDPCIGEMSKNSWG